MMKSKRHRQIMDLFGSKQIISVNDIATSLDVSDMTVRRDLTDLEDQGLLTRVRGGAVKSKQPYETELLHKNKEITNIEEKKHIAKLANEHIVDGDNIFLGPGAVIEILASMINIKNGFIVTNSLPVFNALSHLDIKVILLGGEMRKNSGAFYGDITQSALKKLKFNKAFTSCNGIQDNHVMAETIAEGTSQAMALNNSSERYLLLDSSKFGKEDFYTYYDLNDVTGVFIDKNQTINRHALSKYTSVIDE